VQNIFSDKNREMLETFCTIIYQSFAAAFIYASKFFSPIPLFLLPSMNSFTQPALIFHSLEEISSSFSSFFTLWLAPCNLKEK
jgi:hypothetical protein